jgi:hypothetical protein
MLQRIYSLELRRGTAEVTPVEIKPLLCRKTEQAWSKKQELYAVYNFSVNTTGSPDLQVEEDVTYMSTNMNLYKSSRYTIIYFLCNDN